MNGKKNGWKLWQQKKFHSFLAGGAYWFEEKEMLLRVRRFIMDNHERFQALLDEPNFAMPVKAGLKDKWQIIQPTTEWKTMKTSIKKDDFEVATELYFINVSKL